MRLACVLLLVLAVAPPASAGVIYDFLYWDGIGFEVLGSMEFDAFASNASATSGWSDSGSLSSLLEGGISGFTWEGAPPISGDLSGSVTSIDGSELDAGDFSGIFTLAPGDWWITSLSFDVPQLGLDDVVSGHGSFGSWFVVGDWSLRPIPEPATLSLLGLGGLVLMRRRRVG